MPGLAAHALHDQPAQVTLNYPDGTRLPVGYRYGGRVGRWESWVAEVPPSARLVNGMVVRVNRDTVLTFAVRGT